MRLRIMECSKYEWNADRRYSLPCEVCGHGDILALTAE
jgi:hypothetical protein